MRNFKISNWLSTKRTNRFFLNGFVRLAAISLMFFYLQAQDETNPLLRSWAQHQELKQKSEFGLRWISIGPTMNSARAEAVACDPIHPGTMYVAFGSGNLWKTVNSGLSWRPIFENQSALGIGDIALAPSDTNIIWLGSGESLKKARNFTMPGTGIFRSDDGGETWKNTGLPDTYHTGEIAVHPTNSDIVFVAALGHFWSTNENRGLYRTIDGGKTWEKVLYIDEKTGANDVVISPSNPNIVYASMWENNPTIYGKNSGVYKSEDGGVTWKRLEGGLPSEPKTGRIGLAVSWSNPDKVYALIDNLNKDRRQAAEIYRTDDGGKTWYRTHKDELLIFPGIGWYFADCYVNPQNDDEVYALGVRLARSSNGGKDFELIGGEVYHLFPNRAESLHLDHCELWINPLNPNHIVLCNDGGLYTSHDKGSNWLHHNNIPAGEFYDISVDNQDPYLVYGGTQDDSAVYGPAFPLKDNFADGWKYVWLDAWSGGDGCFTIPDPEDPNTVYFSSQHGHIRRKNMKADKSVRVAPRLPEKEDKELQTTFVTPYFISPHNHKTLYFGGNYVLKTIDRGDNWDVISPDLSKSKFKDKESTAIGAITESLLVPGLLFAGTDGGVFWVSKDDGQNWEEHSEKLPNEYIRSICPSRYSESRVYIAATGINHDDFNNYLFVSEEYGKNWKPISANLPDEMANVILEDPLNENILYAGMYRGVYISTNRGESWSYLGLNMPDVSISDIVIQEREMDMIVATHGRGIYKMNLRPIQKALSPEFENKNYLFDIPAGMLPRYNDSHGDVRKSTAREVPVSFYLVKEEELRIRIIDDQGEIVFIDSIHGRRGFNQFRWDMIRERVESDQPYFTHYQIFVEPGEYQVTITGDTVDLHGKMVLKEYVK